LPFGWIHTVHAVRCAALDDQFGEGAITASDINPALTGGRGKPIKKLLARKLAPNAHHAFVSGTVIETDRRVSHAYIIPSSRRRRRPRI
jgi:hypothetical protein